MGSERRTRLSPEQRRAQLIALGVAFLADRPLDDLTIEELSERAEVSRALIFHYFGSRQGLHQAVVARAGDALLEATHPREELAAVERLRDTLRRIALFVRENRGTFFSLVRGVASGDPEVRVVVDRARDANAQRLREVFAELGVPASPLLDVALRSWVAFAEEVLIELAVDDDVDIDDIVGFLERSVQGVVSAVRV